MRDEDFLRGAAELLSDETRAATVAIMAYQSVLGVRLSASEVEAIADRYRAPRGAVLGLAGWAVGHTPGSRVDILTPAEPTKISKPEHRETLVALALHRSVAGT